MMKVVLVGSVAVAQGVSFEDFVETHGKVYHSVEERVRRFEIFQENMKFVEETNAKGLSYSLGATVFADLTYEEFREQYVGGFVPQSTEHMPKFEAPLGFVMEDSVDWTEKGAVTPVKNQGQCGSCWSFSTTGALEGAMKVAGHDLVSLSEQEIVSCDTGPTGGAGCDGGNPIQALGWVQINGICAEEADPYQCSDQSSAECKSAKCDKSSCKAVLKGGSKSEPGDVTSYSPVNTGVSDLEAAVTRQPISVAIEADTRVFQMYQGGVLSSDACGQNLDHAVLAVGYGTDDGKKYWKVKNSWGPSWGEKGYIRLARGKTDEYGECGIRHDACFPTVRSANATIIV